MKILLELKELSEEREAPEQERAQKFKEEKLPENKLKRKNRKLLKLYKRAELNPRYFGHEQHSVYLCLKRVYVWRRIKWLF